MPQGQSVEMAYRNPQTKKLEFFDLSFENIEKSLPKLSSANPETCMFCHGEGGKVPSAGGPKYIFDLFNDWPRFAGGAHTCTKEEDHLQNLASDRAVQSVKTKKQFDCLDKSVLKKVESEDPQERYPILSLKLAEFDSRTVGGIEADRQKADWLRALPTYENYKYFLLASSGDRCDPIQLKDFFPADVIAKNSAGLEVHEDLRKGKNLEEGFTNAIVAEYRTASETKRQRKNFFENIEELYQKGLPPNYSSQFCGDASEKERTSNVKAGLDILKKLMPTAQSSLDKKDPLLMLQFDNTVRSTPLGQSAPLPALRFFLEGEGYGTFMVQTSFRPGEILRGGIDVPLSLEKEDSELKQMFKEVSRDLKKDCEKDFCFFDFSRKEFVSKNKELTCARLKELSREAFASSNKPQTKKMAQ